MASNVHIVEILNKWFLPSDVKKLVFFICKEYGLSFVYPNKWFSFRLATYGLEELQIEGDGNCQV
jgi:hypothetical protein